MRMVIVGCGFEGLFAARFPPVIAVAKRASPPWQVRFVCRHSQLAPPG